MSEMKFQIGKGGITEGVIESLRNAFKTHKTVRISLLKGSGRDKEKTKEMAEEISNRLGGNFKYTIIGFTIVLRRSMKAKSRQ